MTIDYIKDIIAGCCNDVWFAYNGKPSGVTSEVEDSIPTFQVWHGDDIKYYSTVEEVVTDKFYSGKSIEDLVGVVEFDFS